MTMVLSVIHRVPRSKNDFIMVVTELKKLSLFSDIPSRSYPTFANLKNVLHGKSSAEILEWIIQHLNFE